MSEGGCGCTHRWRPRRRRWWPEWRVALCRAQRALSWSWVPPTCRSSHPASRKCLGQMFLLMNTQPLEQQWHVGEAMSVACQAPQRGAER